MNYSVEVNVTVQPHLYRAVAEVGWDILAVIPLLYHFLSCGSECYGVGMAATKRGVNPVTFGCLVDHCVQNVGWFSSCIHVFSGYSSRMIMIANFFRQS